MAAGDGVGSVPTQMSSSHNSVCQDICTLPPCVPCPCGDTLSHLSPCSILPWKALAHCFCPLRPGLSHFNPSTAFCWGLKMCTSIKNHRGSGHAHLSLADGTAQPLVMQCLLPITGECSPYGGQISAWGWEGGSELCCCRHCWQLTVPC